MPAEEIRRGYTIRKNLEEEAKKERALITQRI